MTNSPRGRYHHGDLSNALTDAATDLARAGGPEAVVLREAARKVGVSATAAYRHFANHDDLIHAVKERSQNRLAAAMRAELAATPPGADPAATAMAQVRAIGYGYLRYALSEPGLFRTAFCRAMGSGEIEPDLLTSESFRLLATILDQAVEAGAIPAPRRPFAELAAWATVHGLAMLLLDGPLAALPEPARQPVIERTIDLVIDGLSGTTGG